MRSAFSSEAVEELEHQLELSLRRIEPNPEFVDHLHSRLTTPVSMSIERRQSIGVGLLLTALSLTTGLFLLWLMRIFRPTTAG
jgi:hypothetical protein